MTQGLVCGICGARVVELERHNHDACMRNVINAAIERCAKIAEAWHPGSQEADEIRATKIEFLRPPLGAA